jgi:hypothetical protein
MSATFVRTDVQRDEVEYCQTCRTLIVVAHSYQAVVAEYASITDQALRITIPYTKESYPILPYVIIHHGISIYQLQISHEFWSRDSSPWLRRISDTS